MLLSSQSGLSKIIESMIDYILSILMKSFIQIEMVWVKNKFSLAFG